jgi:hypothetical protein
MTKKLIALTLVFALSPLSLWAQTGTADRGPRRSPKLAWTGGWLLFGGTALLLGSLDWTIGENYELNHETYCVDEGYHRLNIDRGACTGVGAVPGVRPYAYGLMASGAVLLGIGLQRVKVSPMLAPGVTGARATIRWGSTTQTKVSR